MTVDVGTEVDPLFDVFTDEEERLAAMIRGDGAKAVDLRAVGAAIAAGFILYTLYMKRRLREEVAARDRPMTAHTLYELNSRIFVSGWARIAWTLLPAITQGYYLGLQDVTQGNYSRGWIQTAAEDYATQLAEHLHDTSSEALVQGVQAQINRRVVQRKVIDNVIEAFGAPPRTMNALVNVWSAEPERMLSAGEGRDTLKGRADSMVAKAITERAANIGQTESYAVKNSAKSIVWLYLQQEGQLPKDATKMWITAKDERVCPTCGPLHKMQVPLDAKFPTDLGEVWAPSLHPRCRCDIVLRGAVQVYDSGEYLEEDAPRELELAKSAWGVVSKAKGGDQYDRDKGGKFSTTESRGGRVQVKRSGSAVRGKLDTKRAQEIAQRQEQTRKEVETARQNSKLLSEQERAQLQQSYQEVAETMQQGQVDLAALEQQNHTGQVDLGGQVQLQNTTQVDLQELSQTQTAQQTSLQESQTELDQQQTQLQHTQFEMPQLQIELPTELMIRTQAPPVADDITSDKWQVNPGGDLLYGLFTNVKHAVHYGGHDEHAVVLADDRTEFFASQSDLKRGIQEHWEEVLWEDLGERFQNESHYVDDTEYDDDMDDYDYAERDSGIFVPGYVVVPVGSKQQHRQVKVDFDTYREVFAASLPGSPHRHNRSIPIEYVGSHDRVFGEEDIPINDLIVALKAGSFIEEHMPMIGVTSFINAENSQDVGPSGGRTNPGKWKVRYPYSGPNKVDYDMNFIEPEDLFEDGSDTELIDLPWDDVRSPFDD